MNVWVQFLIVFDNGTRRGAETSDFFEVLVLYSICCWVESTPVVQELRLTLADVASSYSEFEPSGPGTYAFGYDIDDPQNENTQFRDEERYPNGTVSGRYGWIAPNGNIYQVQYTSDVYGYRAHVKSMPNYRSQKRRNIAEIFNY